MVRIKYRNELLERMKKAKKEGRCVECEKKKYAREHGVPQLRPRRNSR